ncbi:MAG: hypothetical protein ABSG95_14465 [Solirubrobacteraceae bacterium]
MQTIAFAAPMLPGKTDADREALASCAHGDRRTEHEVSRRRAGIKRESVWIQSMPGGDVAVVVIEAPDIQAAMGGLATSEEPFDRWFREHVRGVHGIDLAEGFPPPEQVLDFRG